MSDEKMRAEFEAAAEDHFWLQDMCGDYDSAEQQYVEEIVQTAWEFWQLSREALVVELPDCFETYGYSAETARVATDCCAEAIEAAGVRVKP